MVPGHRHPDGTHDTRTPSAPLHFHPDGTQDITTPSAPRCHHPNGTQDTRTPSPPVVSPPGASHSAPSGAATLLVVPSTPPVASRTPCPTLTPPAAGPGRPLTHHKDDLVVLELFWGGKKRKIINLKAKRAPSNEPSPAAGLSPPQWGDRPLPTPGCEAATRAPCPRHLRGLGRRSWPGWCTGTPLSSAPGLSLGPGTPPAPRRRSLSSVSGWGPAGLPGGATSIPVAGSGSCPWHGCLECLV